MPVSALRSSVRAALLGPADALPAGLPVANAGLELTRYLPRAKPAGGEHLPLAALFSRVCDAAPPPDYRTAFARWQKALSALGAVTAEFAVRGRLIVGLGAESVHETAITLHRLWGTPLIPGSALKGLASRFAASLSPDPNDPTSQDDLKPAPASPDGSPRKLNSHGVLFGSVDRAAYVTWLDAWYVPGSAPDDRPLRRDTITVHHPGYYQERGEGRRGSNGPWDFDDPTPVPFVSATGSFLVAVRPPDGADGRPDQAWGGFAIELLARALAEWGVGAKTAAGYGRLARIGAAAHQAQSSSQPAEDKATFAKGQELLARLEGLGPDLRSQRPAVQAIVGEWRGMDDGPSKLTLGRAIRDRLRSAGVLDAWKGEMAFGRLLAYLQARGG